MKVELNLNYEGTFKWTENKGLHFIGYAFDSADRLYQQASDFTVPVQTIINDLQGAFAVIEYTAQKTFVWVDTAASFQLFYKISEDSVLIQCSPTRLGEPLSERGKQDILKIYCTQNSATLLENWKSLVAGHKLTISRDCGGITVERWFSQFSQKKEKAIPETEKKFLKIIDRWAAHIKAFAAGKDIWVPLSGGYDSRLILGTLIRGGVPNIHVYTYGKADSTEAATARKVATELNVDWHFIPYTKDVFNLFFSDEWKEFSEKNHHFQSVPQEQEFFALHYLREKNLLSEGFVVIPGYCGGTPAGNYLREGIKDAKSYLRKRYGVLPEGLLRDEGPTDALEQWIIQNRLSKFLTSGVRIYEYFGGRWMLPMWHHEFLSLFYGLSFEDRFKKRFYKTVIFKYLFEPMRINFMKQKWEEKNRFAALKKFIKKITPPFILNKYLRGKRRLASLDPCNFMVLYELLYEFMKSQKMKLPEKDGNFNHLHATYLLQSMEMEEMTGVTIRG